VDVKNGTTGTAWTRRYNYLCSRCGAEEFTTMQTAAPTMPLTNDDIEKQRAYYNQKWRSFFNPNVKDPDA
jgi:DNA-directed RNA polymerase subunit RPC12/RpoP